jgi:two-component system LytT family response regulator
MTKQVVRALIVDDEQPGRDNVRLALREHPHWEMAAECASVADARAAMAAGGVDVVFLDVQMPQESGMVLAREFAALTTPPIIVFVTAYQHYAVQAFEFHAVDYLLKPFDDDRFALALSRVEDLMALRRRGARYAELLQNYLDHTANGVEVDTKYIDHICVRSVGQLESVAVSDITWIISSGNYVELHLDSRVVLHRTTFSEILNRLDPRHFLRVHRRAMVRRAHCKGLRVVGDGSYQLALIGGDTVPVSERYVGDVRAVLGAHSSK